VLVLLTVLGGGLGARPALAVPAVIPLPATIVSGAGEFRLAATTPLVAAPGDGAGLAAARALAAELATSRGAAPPVRVGAAHDAAIVFEVRAGLGAEGYALEVTPARVTVAATTAAGAFYGATTLAELIPTGRGPVRLAAVRIADAPRFAWRGLMLDSARHYESPRFIRRLIDAMAAMKLNVLHWHLTDDQAWRLEIRRYPRLTQVGAFRVPAGRGARADIDARTGEPRLYGGYYTQKTVRALVAYAALRHVLIVPEIEMPGHASAAIAAYPALGTVALNAVPADWGVYEHVFNLSEPTCRFLENVLEEVAALFPGPYVHVGGDEVATHEWQASPPAVARARELGLAGVEQLPHYLVGRMARVLAAHGKRLVGWDEILAPDLDRGALVQSWRGRDGARAAASQGNDTVLAPWPTLYLDFRQSRADDEPPGRVKTSTLADVYGFEPLPPGLAAPAAVHVVGLQANVWTEHMRTEARIAHAIFPRAAALAEVGWTPAASRDYAGFLARLAALWPRYRRLGLPFADSAFAVRLDASPGDDPGAARVHLATESGAGQIRYTLDGTTPTAQSPRFTGPLTLASGTVLVAASYADGELLGAPRRYTVEAVPESRTSQALELCSEALPLALEIDAARGAPRPVVVLDLMNPCWLWRGVDLSGAPELTASIGPVPFNYQLGADGTKIRVGDARTASGELEVRLDGCEGEILASLPLAAASPLGLSRLAARLPARGGHHDLCLRFARPTLDPMWALERVALRQ
jgi:hexosaminidase